MVPLASATALGVVAGAISLSLLCIWWLLRVEAQESDEDEAIELAEAKAERAAAEDELSPR
jgi:hypothetical protein